MNEQLTTDACGGFKDLVYFRVHLNIEIPIHGQPLGSLLHLLLYPKLEVLAGNRIYDVGDVSSMEVLDLGLLLWQCSCHLRIL